LPHALATINPANIATPALESHQHPQLADPVCHDGGSVTSVTLWQGSMGSAGLWSCAMTNAPESPISPAAARMRRHRERRRDGLRCLTVQLRETEIEALIYRGLLKAEMRNSQNAILNALHAYFDITLVI
jgi:hypothetical protein